MGAILQGPGTNVLGETIIARFDRGYRHIWVGPSIERVTGRPVADFLGRTHRDLGMPEQLCTLWERALDSAFEEGRPVPLDFDFPSPTIGVRRYQAHIAPEAGPDGQITSVMGFAIDVTESHCRLAEVARLTHELEARARRAEEDRRRTASEHEAVCAAAGLACWSLDPDTQISEVDARFAELYGVPAGKVPLEAILARVHPDDIARVREMLTATCDPWVALRYQAEYRVIDAEGCERWVNAHGVPVVEGQGADRRVTRVSGASRDVTERRRWVEALRSSEQRLRLALDAARAGTFEIDLTENIPPEVSTSTRMLFGFGEGERPVTADFVDRVHPEDRARVVDAIERSRVLGEAHYVEYRVRRPDGSEVWIGSRAQPVKGPNGKVKRLVGVLMDVTERRRAEDTLRESNALLRAISASTGDVIFAKDREGRLTYANAGTLTLFGRTAEEVIGKTDAELLHDAEAAARVMENDRRILASGIAEEVEEMVPMPDGSPRYWSSRKVPFRDNEGRVIGVLGVARDVTGRKRVEEQLWQAKREAEDANLAKDRFLAVLSHELRTPLTPVALSAMAMEADPRLPREFRDEVAMIRRNVELETRLIDDLLDLNRAMLGKLRMDLRPTRLNDVVRHAVDTVRSDLRERRVQLEVVLATGDDAVLADAARLQQALWNLLKNAAKFTPPDGQVTVETFRSTTTPEWVGVRVSDTGKGISPESLTRIFDPFEQGDPDVTRRFGGMGLGLAIARSVVDLHGGQIRAESDGDGCGATFTIELPLAASILEVVPEVEEPPCSDAGQGPLRVLLVEDHPDTGRTLERLLKLDGTHVRWANTMAAAVEAVGLERFDIVVSDLGLPDGSGHDLLRELHRQIPGMAAIAMSGYGMDEDLKRSREAGFAAHLVKPVALPQLRDTIRRVAQTTGKR